MALKKSHLKPRYIFITTPNMSVLQERLETRMSIPNSSSTRNADVDPLSETFVKEELIYEAAESMTSLPPITPISLQGHEQLISIADQKEPISANDLSKDLETLDKEMNASNNIQSLITHKPISNESPDLNNEDAMHSNQIAEASQTIGIWINKAKHEINDYQDIIFDMTIVNDDLEKAYKELKEYCLSMYWKDFNEEE